MQEKLEKALQEIGLSEKEAKVYLAGLELGPATAQTLAAKSSVSRPNTYIMIESLIKKGLMTSFEKGKKKFFVTMKGDKLHGLLIKEQKVVNKRLQTLQDIIPELLSVSNGSVKPRIQLYEGDDALRNLYEDMVEVTKKDKSIDNIAAIDQARKTPTTIDLVSFWNQLDKNKVKIRTLFSSEKDSKSLFLENPLWTKKKLPSSSALFSGEISIYGNHVAAISYSSGINAILIESKEIAETLRVLFDLAWHSAKP